MNYFFTPFAIVNQYQPYYGFIPQMLVQTKAYYIQEPPFEKQIAALQCSQAQFELQFVSKPIDSPGKCHKKHQKLKKKEDKNFGFRDQDKERNIFSNILKGFFIVLTQKRGMDSFLESMLLRYANGMDIEDFLQKVSQIFSKCKSYFSPKSVRQILRIEKGEKIIRLIVQKCLYKYLKTEFSINLLLSKRIKRKSKLLQMRKSRELLSILRGSE